MGSEIGAGEFTSGSVIGVGATGVLVLGGTGFFLGADFPLALTFFAGVLATFLATFFTAFFTLLDVFFLLDVLLLTFFLACLTLATARFAFATGRFFALLFFFAMVTLLLAVLRLPVLRVSSKKSAVI